MGGEQSLGATGRPVLGAPEGMPEGSTNGETLPSRAQAELRAGQNQRSLPLDWKLHGVGPQGRHHCGLAFWALRRPHSRTVVLHVPLAASRSRLRQAGLRGSRGCTDESACPLEANDSPRRPVAEELGIPPTGPRRPTPCGPRPSCPRRCTPSTAWPARCSSRPTGPWTSCWVAEEGGGRRAAALLLLLLLLMVGLPLALPGLLLWLALQVWRRPFCYRPPPLCWAPPALWRPTAEPGPCSVFLTANPCGSPTGYRASATYRTASDRPRPLAPLCWPARGPRSTGLRTAASRGPGRRAGRWWPRCPWVWTSCACRRYWPTRCSPQRGQRFGREGGGSWGRPWCCWRGWAAWTGTASWDSRTARICKHWLRTGPCAANS
ncbi:uncharacterized protein [Symphalangus syndactylus]|uniref:uncharacterized protein isoform X2 n=1 Tax=Symphalangus syndactylus TaxID=9590 RepID=UPI003005317E